MTRIKQAFLMWDLAVGRVRSAATVGEPSCPHWGARVGATGWPAPAFMHQSQQCALRRNGCLIHVKPRSQTFYLRRLRPRCQWCERDYLGGPVDTFRLDIRLDARHRCLGHDQSCAAADDVSLEERRRHGKESTAAVSTEQCREAARSNAGGDPDQRGGTTSAGVASCSLVGLQVVLCGPDGSSCPTWAAQRHAADGLAGRRAGSVEGVRIRASTGPGRASGA